jgi:hypothetical protein
VADEAAETGQTGVRGVVYRALKRRGEKGVLFLEMMKAGITTPGIHIESLRCEGHGIDSRPEKDGKGNPGTRFFLTKDAWA